jgi:uncharacterized membrane protein
MRTKPNWSFWLIGALGLIWNLMGTMNFAMQMKADALATMPEPFHTIIANRPAWATGAFAVGVISGVFGCIMLLLRNRIAKSIFVVSLLGLAIHLIPYLSPQNLPENFGTDNIMLVFVAPMAVGLFLLWYARFANKKNWLN